MAEKPTINTWRVHWDKMAERNSVFDQVNRDTLSLNKDVQYIKQLLPLNHKITLADICCGNGLFTVEIAPSCDKVIGVDLSEDQIKSARQYSKDRSVANVEFHTGESTNTGLEANSVDHVVCMAAVEFFPDLEYSRRSVDEMLRIVRPGGYIVLTDIPNKESFYYYIWRTIRNKNFGNEIEPIIMQPTLSRKRQLTERIKLLTRRFSNRHVESDHWTWFSKAELHSIIDMEKVDNVTFSPSNRKGLLRYCFDVVIQRRSV